ncbi:antibiotic biosynthesis monooxygenase family protein [Anoxybacillus sp. B7M1]|jgi:heme oxygenase (mycobilin-producing)|uniref:Antibiotic biosynthesis monooxygenase n=1 Tax=Anoxybacteroides rupiense TaxID=311460 RepID=A0ABD5IUW3_9BACL|nr:MULTISPECIES: antibiotic biosynthesis monooxygenase [Anoxybacillus]ANB56469.1 antibiotic biosynthesis monooxygenase family protein [Anoxybacillus sp. B2M1]ANB64573.1 antibiotic biosynthesis monooxygenase family protein [Anoxybacillus sp. B7M1]MBS2771740.1 antibiotic biosynthesis monooxygenase [Anoxybacillus rupiensis]MDE8564167.1 antibiotic biosynthesis monooxygenase [Anoxybacillus rupiensis]MED5051782.1 antibiotic biosynthesis monooxygenase [Anoxybacillus rupiensis]
MKKIYVTTGTRDYLQKLKDSYAHETMLLLEGEDGAALFHETDGSTVFQEPRHYEVIDAVGNLGGSFAVLNHIPVTDEGRPLFEYRFSQRAGLIEKEPGFVAIRVLRPLSNDTYIIMTLWEGKEHFQNWQRSRAFEKAHHERKAKEEEGQQVKLFPRPSYVTTYSIIE